MRVQRLEIFDRVLQRKNRTIFPMITLCRLLPTFLRLWKDPFLPGQKRNNTEALRIGIVKVWGEHDRLYFFVDRRSYLR